MEGFLLEAAALLLYPGLLAVAGAGFLCELVMRLGASAALLRLLRRSSPALLAVAAFSCLAAAQLAAPFSPAGTSERNLLVAVIAAAAAAWVAWAAGGGRDGKVVLGGLAALVIGALTPAVLAQDLHPQVLGVEGLVQADPLHLAAAAAYIAGVAALLVGLAGTPARLLFWLPLAGLFTSVYLPRPADDLVGVLQFYGATAGVAALAAGLGLLFDSLLRPKILRPM